jgi:hypothetical protein
MSDSDGAYLFNTWRAGNEISQTLNNMPAGRYRLTAVMATDAEKELQLKMGGQTSKANSIEKGTGVKMTVEATLADKGNLAISAVTKDNYWYKVDDFRLTYLGNGSTSANLKVDNDKLGTFIAPFAIVLPKNVKAYSATSSDTEVTLKKEYEGEKTLPAGTPVIVYGDGVSVDMTFYGDATVTDNQTVGALTGILDDSKKTVPVNSYVLQTQTGNQAFYKLSKDATGKLNRCYVTAGVSGSGEARLAISFDEDVTAINAIEEAGAKTEGLKDGKYLIGGKIVIVNNGVKYSANGQKLN